MKAVENKGKQKPQVEQRDKDQDLKVNIKRIRVKSKTDHNCDFDASKFITSIQFNHTDSRNKNGESCDNFLKQLQFKLVGPYICYRHYSDDRVRIRKIIHDNNDARFEDKHERFICLDNLITVEDRKYVTINRVPSRSTKTVKYRSKSGKLYFYANLLQITFRTDCYIFDLDQSSDSDGLHPKEIDFGHNTNQLMNLDEFIDTGTCN